MTAAILSNIIAILALGVSGYAIWTTTKFNKRQLSLIETQERLNKKLLEQGESEALESRKADIGASLVNSRVPSSRLSSGGS